MRIPIVVSIDSEYINYLLVLYKSLLDHANKTYEYELIVTVSDEERIERYDILTSAFSKYSNSSVRILTVGSELLCNAETYEQRYKAVVYYRLVLPQLLPEYDKVIYLDSDILVNLDISNLFLTDIDSSYVAGVVDKCVVNSLEQENPIGDGWLRKSDLCSQIRKHYINAGVLLLNLRKMREDNMQSVFTKHMKGNYMFNDQDIINIHCYPDVYLLDSKYNYFSTNGGSIDNKIIHYAGGMNEKPWLSLRRKFSREWWQTAQTILSKETYDTLYEKARAMDAQSDFSHYVDQLLCYHEVYIIGEANEGKEYSQFLEQYGIRVNADIYERCNICKDDQYTNWLDFLKDQINIIIVYMAELDDKAISLIDDRDIPRMKIYEGHKNYYYYRALDADWYEYEINEICFINKVNHEDGRKILQTWLSDVPKDMLMTDIAIIVPLFHGQQYISSLSRMIRKNVKLLQQEYPDVEVGVIFINDCPEERIIVPEFGLKTLCFQDDKNRGIHGARVKGLTYSGSKYILFLDQDDELYDDYLLKQYRLIETQQADVVVCNAYHNGEILYTDEEQFHNITDLDAYIFIGNRIISPGQTLIKRDSIPQQWTENILKKNGVDDFFLWLLMLSNSNVSFAINKEILFHHVNHVTNLSLDLPAMDESRTEMLMILYRLDLLAQKYIDRLFLVWISDPIEKKYRCEVLEVDYSRERYISLVFEKLLQLYENRGSMARYFSEHGYRTASVYGYGRIGKKLLPLINKEIQVISVIDKRKEKLTDLTVPVVAPEEKYIPADLMVITAAIGQEQIKQRQKEIYPDSDILDVASFLNAVLQ